jgi:tetratricopeptide (TPR) repeat protein
LDEVDAMPARRRKLADASQHRALYGMGDHSMLPEWSETAPDLPEALILAELARILASASLHHAPQLQRLLRHLVTVALAGETYRLRELSIALDCFGRSASRYDPRRDPIVRVAANRLREKLRTYYDRQGAAPYVRVELPVGTYVPVFLRCASGPSRDAVNLPPHAASGTLAKPVAHGGTNNPVAKDLADRGRFALRQQGILDFRKAVDLFTRATEADPRFASAWSGLALGRLGLVGMTAVPSAPEVAAAKAAAMRAFALDPRSSEACSSLAVIAFRYEFDWTAAEPLHREAVRLEPASRYAHHAYAFGLVMNRRFVDADVEYHVARDIDPLDQALRCQHALVAIYTGRYDDARAELDAILEVDERNLLARTLLGATRLYAGDVVRALEDYEWALAAHPRLSIGVCGKAQALAVLGRADEAEALMCELINRTEGYVSPYQVALVQARLGHDGACLDWLDRAGRERDANFVCAMVDPAFERYRCDKRWRDVLARHGLAVETALP